MSASYRDCLQLLESNDPLNPDNPNHAKLEGVLTPDGVIGEDLMDGSGKSNLKAICGVWAGLAHPIDTAKAAKDKVAGFWNDPVGKFTRAVMEGNTQMLTIAMTFWMDYNYGANGQLDANIRGVLNIVLGISGFFLIAGFIIGGARIAASRRMGLQEGIEDVGSQVGHWLVYSTLVPAIATGGFWASDALAQAIMDNFGATDPNSFIEMTALEDVKLGPVVMLVLGLVALAGSCMQLVALVIRQLMLPIAVGIAALFAAASFSETGKNGLKHLEGWIIAAIAFKPISALFYSVTLWYVTLPGSGDDMMGAIINALMIALAGFSAPALVRMIVPAVAQAGGGSAGAFAAGVGGAAGATLGALGSMGGGLSALMGGKGGTRPGGSGGGAAGGGGGPFGGGGGVGARTSAGTPSLRGPASTAAAPSGAPRGNRLRAGGGGGGGGGSAAPSGANPGSRSTLGGTGRTAASTESQPGGARTGAASRARAGASAAGRGISGASRVIGGAARNFARGTGAVVAGASRAGVQAAQFIQSTANSGTQIFEGSLGYPGQMHR
ncbi:hypothetical protein C1Y63_06215 [Corynebacterium sp. 13CS0277]|uniref:hypothetical protein n=1 Tax=Corynebacterium sp. 13CS0277 TaxID=2071994 RepID=UPI000D4E2CB1|nr:hypothetical protein [Corynebacterium sp. 13CS0277]PRQ11441.1 hypothetical protein C1Y63_06215 [Corynebacterium sp. 13CS0277]